MNYIGFIALIVWAAVIFYVFIVFLIIEKGKLGCLFTLALVIISFLIYLFNEPLLELITQWYFWVIIIVAFAVVQFATELDSEDLKGCGLSILLIALALTGIVASIYLFSEQLSELVTQWYFWVIAFLVLAFITRARGRF